MYSLIYFLKHLSNVLSELLLTNVPSKMLSNTLFELNYCLLYGLNYCSIYFLNYMSCTV